MKSSRVLAMLCVCLAGIGAARLLAQSPPAADARVAAFGSATNAAPSASTSAVRLQKAELVDSSGFARPMLAATALVPAGWRSEGAIVWAPHGQCGPDYAARWIVSAPDGLSGMAVLPAPNWSGTRSAYPTGAQQNPCGEAFHTSARGYLEAAARQLYRDVRILDYRSLPDEARPYQQMIDSFPPIDNATMQSRLTVDAGELLVAFTENGQDMRALVGTIAFITQSRFADIMNPGRVAFESVSGAPTGLVIVRAPNGQLDFSLRRRLMGTVRYTSEWSEAIAAFNAKKSAAVTDNMIAGHKARMDAIRKTGEISTGIYEDRQLTSDRMQRETIESIRGVETYHDPADGRPVQLDNTYDHAWRMNDGSYVLTNDPNFNPDAAFGMQGQPLQRLP
jgi:hypothetical protein